MSGHSSSLRLLSTVGLIALAALGSCAARESEPVRVEVSFSRAVHEGPLTGRLFLAISPAADPEPRIGAYWSARKRDGSVPFFSLDVAAVEAGQTMVVGSNATGYPYADLASLPPGRYWAQALLHVYTRFDRSDGHVVWAPMDHWEGQRWGFSPGNLVSEPARITIEESSGDTLHLELTRTLPEVEPPQDTERVKHLKIESPLLSKFWGRPIHLGATVLLPRDYQRDSTSTYPVVYQMGHFDLSPPFGFSPQPIHKQAVPTDPGWRPEVESQWLWMLGQQVESGHEFYRSWMSDDFPRVLAVRLQHPTPYFDDSYGVNSANNGPYGDALLGELIPHLEKKFRAVGSPWARVLTGGSTGGWMALAMQVHNPRFFGGAWVLYPDPVDFRRLQLIDIYQDDNAFLVPGAVPGAPERMFQRTVEGQPLGTIRQMSRLEAAQGSKGRSGGQLDIWNATYGPVGEDGYPIPLWDKETGEIHPEVARHWRESGYDLTHYLRTHWQEIGPHLVGKLHIVNPEQDDFYLSPSVYLLEEFLESTTDPAYAGEFFHGRPLKGHGWQPWTNAELVRRMARHMERNR